MKELTLEERAKRGRRLLGLCLSAVLGVFAFVVIFDVLIFRRIGLNQIAAAFGILLVVGAMRGEKMTRVVLGIWLAFLSLNQVYIVATEITSGRTSGWTTFSFVVGGVYITAAFVLLTIFDIRAYEIVKERSRRVDGEWIAVVPEEAPAQQSFAPGGTQPGAAVAFAESANAPRPAPPAQTAVKPAQQFPLVCTVCGRLSAAGAISCKKCGKPFPAIKAARQT